MLVKTKGIVLNQIKYSDSGVVVQAYTREYGRQSFMVKGMRSRRSGRHSVFLQPMFLLDMIFYYRDTRSMQVLKEYSVYYLPSGICSDVKKSCIAVFLGEIMFSVLREESPHVELYDYIEDSVIYLDKHKSGFGNFHIAFLIGLCSYLGFEPGKRTNMHNGYFDLLNGIFVASPPDHPDYAEIEISDILADFFNSSFEHTREIPLTGKLRNEVLETIIRYYSIHLPGLKKINSLGVLKEIFS